MTKKERIKRLKVPKSAESVKKPGYYSIGTTFCTRQDRVFFIFRITNVVFIQTNIYTSLVAFEGISPLEKSSTSKVGLGKKGLK